MLRRYKQADKAGFGQGELRGMTNNLKSKIPPLTFPCLSTSHINSNAHNVALRSRLRYLQPYVLVGHLRGWGSVWAQRYVLLGCDCADTGTTCAVTDAADCGLGLMRK